MLDTCTRLNYTYLTLWAAEGATIDQKLNGPGIGWPRNWMARPPDGIKTASGELTSLIEMVL